MLFFRIITSLAIFVLFSCSNFDNQKKPKLRIVDLQGKPHNVEMKTPELNYQALASQGRLSEEKIAEQKKKVELPNNQIASNKYASNPNIEGSSSEAIKNTLQLATDPQQQNISSPNYQAPEISDRDIITTKQSQQNQEVSYNLTNQEKGKNQARVILSNKAEGNLGNNQESHTSTAPQNLKTNQSSIAKITKKQKGIFVQTGSFSILQRAKSSAQEVAKFIPRNTKTIIEEGESEGKTVYRVLIGPFSTKQKAGELISQLNDSGYQAIIIRNK